MPPFLTTIAGHPTRTNRKGAVAERSRVSVWDAAATTSVTLLSCGLHLGRLDQWFCALPFLAVCSCR